MLQLEPKHTRARCEAFVQSPESIIPVCAWHFRVWVLSSTGMTSPKGLGHSHHQAGQHMRVTDYRNQLKPFPSQSLPHRSYPYEVYRGTRLQPEPQVSLNPNAIQCSSCIKVCTHSTSRACARVCCLPALLSADLRHSPTPCCVLNRLLEAPEAW